MKRTHHCNQLRDTETGQKVVLAGWVNTRRDHGGIVFIDLRDREGLTQIVFDPQHHRPSWDLAQSLRSEYVVAIEGAVRPRPAGTANPRLPTGEIEVLAHQLEVLNTSETPPFPLDDETAASVGEELRLEHRYLDLRRPRMARNLRLRHQLAKATRDYFDAEGFLEVETPMLFKSTPEGAREYLVPSRVNPGKFYALPQSPQQYKQMLMVAGVERYFQIAKCFRDEDLRADRQPEFTQIDVEMSFIDRDDMLAMIEGLLAHLWQVARGEKLATPFRRL
ncbi:aspartate--tRNA ligase, partial [bacterium]|nr:aspartate--tRNA ligase [bacterium]